MSWLKNLYHKIIKPAKWIEIPLHRHNEEKKEKQEELTEEEEDKTHEEE